MSSVIQVVFSELTDSLRYIYLADNGNEKENISYALLIYMISRSSKTISAAVWIHFISNSHNQPWNDVSDIMQG